MSTAISYLDFLSNAGFPPDEDAAKRVAAASRRQLENFREVYLQQLGQFNRETCTGLDSEIRRWPVNAAAVGAERSGRVFHCPPAKKGEFRPLYHPGILDMSRAGLGTDKGTAFDAFDLEDRIRRIKGLLLYSHAVVLSDSLFSVNELFGSSSEHFIQIGRVRLQNYLTLLAAVRPLIEREIIIFYPQFEHGGVGFGNQTGFADSAYEKWLGEDLAMADDPHYLRLVFATQNSEELLFFANRYEASAVYPAQPAGAYEQALEYSARYHSRALKRHTTRDSFLARRLGEVDLPRLDELKLADIVAIRRDDETFHQWRTSLATAIDQIDNYQELEADKVLPVVQDVLAEGRYKLEDAMGKWSFASVLKGATSGLALGSLGSWIAKGDLDLRSGAAGAGVAFLYQYMTGAGKRGATEALKRHYAVFESEKE